ncbi:acetylxylan esterase [Verrucomicrobium sp. BvORR034]|uniref:alpha/beta hydrolase n=1 Tax=Verrucomicrobium sp. BvORR034 TaxID=1396418 RepID=UPI002240FC5A|nr:acetylxylan esterase [Verrucomicrobium sp. BvORR034]
MRSPSFLSWNLLMAAAACGILLSPSLPGAADDKQGEGSQAAYFERQVSLIEDSSAVAQLRKETWNAFRDQSRAELAEMLGLDLNAPRTDLKVTKTGEFEHEGVVVENLHYQSRPGLYVTANLYRPKVVDKPLPTVLYVCGHSNMVKDGVSYGNKTGYEHHGVWYAKHGFVCLIIDTVQLGEIAGEHHGTYRLGKWWWMARGYTPAGVEAWAGIRALDYLETRPEVDKTRFGVAGRSGGGAYSWFVAALDERIKCAVPTAGITTLRNHVVDGCVSGHCDCMFFVNTFRWDYDRLAALVAPRALLVTNTDKDGIFPIDGVFDIYQSTRRVYKALGAEQNIGLHIAEGPHKDLQPLNTGEFHWMMRHLQSAGLMDTTDAPAVKGIPMEKLRVFQELPPDQINTRVDEVFVPLAGAVKAPEDSASWDKMRAGWMEALRTRCFAGWSGLGEPAAKFSEPVVTTNQNVTLTTWKITPSSDRDPQGGGDLFLLHGAAFKPEDLQLMVLHVLDDEGWKEFGNTFGDAFPSIAGEKVAAAEPDAKAFDQERGMLTRMKWGMIYFCPRGVGPRALSSDLKTRTHQLRRYYLLGQTLEGQQVWDVRCAIRGLHSVEALKQTPLWIQASRHQAGNALYASLFEDGITRLDLHEVPASHRDGPIYLNVLKYLDLPQAAAMAAQRTRVIIYADDRSPWELARSLNEKFAWDAEKKAGLQLRDLPKPR